MYLDWEEKNYDFNSMDCMYSWRDIRLMALRSELHEHPEAVCGDLLITFHDNGFGGDILDHFSSYDNFRHGSVEDESGESVVNILLAPIF
jgi:hypothetical protein